MLNSVPVEWLSRKQPMTAVSPAEAEVYAMREAVVISRLAQWVAEEMGMRVQWPLEMFTDSTQARSFQHNTCPNSKMRGCYDLREQAVRELRDKEVVSATYIRRDLNIADLLTHCLAKSKFKEMVARAQNLHCHISRVACVYNCVFSVPLERVMTVS